MKIGDRIYVRGYVDEIRKDTVIVRNDGGYFGTIPSEVITGELPFAQPEQIIRCTNCRFFKRNIPCTGGHYNGCEMWLDDGNEIRVMTDDYCSKALPKEGEQDG